MPYATPADLARRLPAALLAALADDNSDGNADTEVLEAALAQAAADIDQQLGARYLTPLEPAPAIATFWCATLAAEALYARREGEVPAALRADADVTRRALQAIHDGLATLAGATPRPADLLADATRDAGDIVFDLGSLGPY